MYVYITCYVEVNIPGACHVVLINSTQVGRTPIMAAASKGHKEVIKVLLKHGADVLVASYEVMMFFKGGCIMFAYTY